MLIVATDPSLSPQLMLAWYCERSSSGSDTVKVPTAPVNGVPTVALTGMELSAIGWSSASAAPANAASDAYTAATVTAARRAKASLNLRPVVPDLIRVPVVNAPPTPYQRVNPVRTRAFCGAFAVGLLVL